jgi:hypothetical protein
LNRRLLLSSLAAGGALVALPGIARAQGIAGLGPGSIPGRATDSALDKLARPGTFYDDEDIRIGLPVIGNLGGALGDLLQQ